MLDFNFAFKMIVWNHEYTNIILTKSLFLARNPFHSGKKAANSFGELGPKREVVLNGFKGPESDFGGSKIRKDL